jgi:hypothetical protein
MAVEDYTEMQIVSSPSTEDLVRGLCGQNPLEKQVSFSTGGFPEVVDIIIDSISHIQGEHEWWFDGRLCAANYPPQKLPKVEGIFSSETGKGALRIFFEQLV